MSRVNDSNTSLRSRVYECYMNGFDVEKALENLGVLNIKKPYIEECYNSFAAIKQSNVQYKMVQIQKIERKLFELMDEHKANPKAITSHLINELSSTYSKFLVL